ncbi:MAG: YIP1 family protein [Crocinitomicaceae bacterium]|nr:YIP1 family protein [Crocinitomicaceae bacterium]
MLIDETPQKPLEEFSDKELFTKIWISPRKVFKYLHDKSYDKFLYPLLFLAGLTNALNNNRIDNENAILIKLIIGAVIGGLLGWIGMLLFAAIMSWTGKWINGKAETMQLLRVSAYAYIPSIVAVLSVLILILLFGPKVLAPSFTIETITLPEILIYFFLLLIQFSLAVWAFILYLIGISVAQNFSIGKAFLNILLSLMVILLPLLSLFFLLR